MTPAGDPDVHPYASPLYARALAGLGRAVETPQWGGFVLARPLPGGAGEDALGAYPMAALSPSADLDAGLRRLKGEGLTCLVMVPDPLCGPDAAPLEQAFDVCRPFKTHHLVDPGVGPFDPSAHHRERIRRGLRRCRIERVRLADHLDAWTGLYAGLVERKAIGGAAAFGPPYFDALAQMAPLVAFAAFVEGRLCAMTLWFAHGGVAYNHLTASNAEGYANGASFALYDAAIGTFADEVINLGGGAGRDDDAADGLAAFKRGFANSSVTARLCGAILDTDRYAALSADREDRGFFPAYRG